MFNLKKGLISLESLIEVILSIIALVLILSFLVHNFLKKPTNYNIAYENAKSIVDFVNLNIKNNNQDCFNLLNMKNLENFQKVDLSPEYFYIITNKGVFIDDIKDFQNKCYGEISKKYIIKNPSKDLTFAKSINLFYDDTSKKNFDLSIFFLHLYSTNTNFKLKNEQDSVIFLVPLNNNNDYKYFIINKNTGCSYNAFSGYNQLITNSPTPNQPTSYMIGNLNFLVFSNYKNDYGLIPLEKDSLYSTVHIFFNLCADKKINYNKIQSNYKKVNIDYDTFFTGLLSYNGNPLNLNINTNKNLPQNIKDNIFYFKGNDGVNNVINSNYVYISNNKVYFLIETKNYNPSSIVNGITGEYYFTSVKETNLIHWFVKNGNLIIDIGGQNFENCDISNSNKCYIPEELYKLNNQLGFSNNLIDTGKKIYLVKNVEIYKKGNPKSYDIVVSLNKND